MQTRATNMKRSTTSLGSMAYAAKLRREGDQLRLLNLAIADESIQHAAEHEFVEHHGVLQDHIRPIHTVLVDPFEETGGLD
jgi:hypothetical protein